MKKFVVRKSQRLKEFTDETYAQGSFALARLLREREIRVNGARTGKDVLLAAGDEVAYYTTPREEAVPFYAIVYRDENILIADKYAGVSSEALFAALREEYGARFIHRLDRNTSGLIAFARTDAAEEELLSAFRERRAEKIYEAVCFHPFARPHALLTAYLRKDARAAKVRIFPQPTAGAEKIVTEYTVRAAEGEHSLVEVRLHSGKTHQIRAHMAFIGHPVAGDEKYGDEALNRRYGVRRQLLVAKRLAFDAGGAPVYLRGRVFVSSFSPRLPAAGKNCGDPPANG